MSTTETRLSQETWVGRALERFEDDALLRGAGRFLDDLDPAPGAHHAAVLRSPHATRGSSASTRRARSRSPA